MTSITATARGYKASKKILGELDSKLSDILEDSLDKFAAKIEADANGNLQDKTHVVTGELLAEPKILEKGEKYRVIGSRKIQGYIVEHGRGLVLPKKGKVLHWIDKHTGEDVFATKSGPVDPDPWLEPAVNRNKKGLKDIIAEDVKKIVRNNNHD